MLRVIQNAFEVILDSKLCLEQCFGMCLSSDIAVCMVHSTLFLFPPLFLLLKQNSFRKIPSRFAEKGKQKREWCLERKYSVMVGKPMPFSACSTLTARHSICGWKYTVGWVHCVNPHLGGPQLSSSFATLCPSAWHTLLSGKRTNKRAAKHRHIKCCNSIYPWVEQCQILSFHSVECIWCESYLYWTHLTLGV